MIKKQVIEEILNFKTLEDFKEIKNNYQNIQKVKFNCQKCEKNVVRFVGRINFLINKNQFNFLCKDCQRKKTSLERYGIENPSSTKQAKEKSLATKIKNNNLNSEKRLNALRKAFENNNEEIQEKRKQTNLKKYGQKHPLYEVICPFCDKEMDNTHLTRHKKCCEKNPKNYIEEKDGIITLTNETIQKLNKLPKSLKFKKKVSYTCEKCKQNVTLKSFNWFKSFNTCPKCERKETCIKKYNGNAPACSKHVQEKMQQTSLERYGVEYAIQNKYILNKRKQTNLEKYNVEEVSQNKNIREKQIKTLLNKTKEEKEAIQTKTKQTMLEKYSVEYALQNKDLKKKAREGYEKTCLEKYGMLHAPRSTYIYNNEKFDSIPELAFYIYNVDQNKNIIRCPVEYEYIVFGKKHYYIPDFSVDNQVIEIKGNHFLNEDGTWHNPFSLNKIDNELTEAKHQCALENNVKILYYEDYKIYIDYVVQKYGSLDYLQQFKKN